MKTIPAAIQAELDSGTPRLATLWRLTRRDGQVFRFTDHDQDIEQGGVTYLAAVSYNRTATADQSGFAPANMEIESVLDDDVILAEDIIAGLWDYAQVEIWATTWNAPENGQYNYRKGRIGEVSTSDNTYRAEFFGLAKPLLNPVARPYLPGCQAALGDAECTVSLGAHTVTGTIAAVDGTGMLITDAARTEADNTFSYGIVTMTSGSSSGYSMEVKSSLAAGSFTLQQPLPFGVAAGDTYSLVKGCDKTFATCKDTFNNAVNFRGFPHMPGMDKVMQYATR